MIYSRRKSIHLNRIEWLIKGSKSWLESCTDLITLGEKLAMSSWTIFLFVFWLRVTIKWLSYENLSKQVMPWSGSVGKRVLKRFLKCWQTGIWTNKICPSQHLFLDWNSTAMARTWDKHLRLSRTTISSTSATLWIEKERLRSWHAATTN